MAWSIGAYGSKAEVRAILEKADISPTSPEIERQQFTKIKEMLLFTVEAINDRTKGFKVEAFGSMEIHQEGEEQRVSNDAKISIETFELIE